MARNGSVMSWSEVGISHSDVDGKPVDLSEGRETTHY